jgi:hypothetical protein
VKSAILLTLALATQLLGAPPQQESVSVVLGPKAYRDGDAIEITDITCTSANLEQGDSVTVRGRVRLDSQQSANLCLFLTQTESSGHSEIDAGQLKNVTRGITSFELSILVKHRGALHVTLYDATTGKPFGGTYFGTANQMKQLGTSSVQHYSAD